MMVSYVVAAQAIAFPGGHEKRMPIPDPRSAILSFHGERVRRAVTKACAGQSHSEVGAIRMPRQPSSGIASSAWR
jgi:hypothetical protein